MNALLRKPFDDKKAVLFFTIAWLLVNLLQAFFTGLANDEAYYWMYARKLSIGYFDHPPMIAVMIRIGDFLLQNELGLRLLTVLFSTALIPVMYALTGKKDFPLLALLLCSSTVFQIYGFIAVPDAPLLFFTALFFLCYRNYLRNDGWKKSLLLIVVIALLLYSKYHGFLVLFFTLLSNLKLFTRKSFYAVIAGVIVLYLPHIWWQIANDYPSYQYHVLNKSQSVYDVMDSVAFIGGLLLVAGPLTGGLLIAALVKQKAEDPLQRAMKFVFFGFVLFFFVSTFNAPIEANWLAASIVPLVALGHRYVSEHVRWRKWAMGLSAVSLAIFLFARINLVTDFVPALGSKPMPEFYGWKEWSEKVKEHAHGLPVVIMNSYQKASKYSFYQRTEALSLNNVAYRRNQYDIWDIVDQMQGKKVAVFVNYWPGQDSLEAFVTPRGKMQVLVLEHFRPYTKVRITTDKDWYHFPPNTDVEIPLTFIALPEQPLTFDHDPVYPASLVCERYYYEKFDQEIPLLDLDAQTISATPWKQTVKLHTPEREGPYYLRFSIKTGKLPGYINSHLIRMDVER